MTLALVNLCAAGVMTGVIWFTQIVHYPLFAHIPVDCSPAYAIDNQRRTSYVVGLPMVTEGICAVALFANPPGDMSRLLPTLSGLVLAVVLASTISLQVPRHAELTTVTDSRAVHDIVSRLVRSNWIRTIGWTTRMLLAAVMVAIAAG